MDDLLESYSNPRYLKLHLHDINELDDKARAMGFKVYFLAFPFLNNQDLFDRSAKYIAILKVNFVKTCKSGDVFFDFSPLVTSVGLNNSVVNAMDPHPSAKLHKEVSKYLSSVILSDHSFKPLSDVITYCKR